jgi:hypothetical protein
VSKPDLALVNAAVKRCERHAEELFDGDTSFTQTTTWDDGDFRVLVWHGLGYDEEPYRQSAEKVTYNYEEGSIYYAEFTRYIDRHDDEYHESRRLEDFDPSE